MANKSCEDLPDECWELILSKLHHRRHSLLEPPSLSCKRFLAITNALRTRLSILRSTTVPLPTLFRRFPNVNSIHLDFFCRGDDLRRVIADIATSGLNLKTFDCAGSDGLHLDSWRLLGSRMNNIRVLNCSCLLTLCDVELVVIADSMPCLEDLDISYPVNGNDPDWQGRSLGEVGVTDSGIEAMSLKLKGLREICMSGNDFITDKSLIALSTNCVDLRVISALSCGLLTLVGIEFVLLNCTSLSELSVDDIDFDRLDDGSIRCARNLSTLNIHDSGVSNECLHLLAKAGVPLKKFSLTDYSCSPRFTFSGISSVLNKYRFLERISLEGIDFLTDETMISLSQCLYSLVTISLDRCGNLTESTLFMLAKNCPSLENIIMVGTNVGGGGDKVATNVVKNPQIKFLNLANNQNLSDECLAKLASVCPSLEALLVSYCEGITERGIADFLKSGSSRLRSLRINKCGGIKSIGNGFELSKLDFIGAARSGINDDGLVVVGNRCHGLLDLDLDGCLGVTTVGLKEVLTNCKRLRTINLTGCLNVCMETLDWMVFSRSSPRKIIVPQSYLPSESQRQLFLLHGCLVLSDKQKWSRDFLL